MDYLFFQTLAINGFDGIGHYLRANLLVNLCSTYAIAPATGCNSNFKTTKAVGRGSRRRRPGSRRRQVEGHVGASAAAPIVNGLLGNRQAPARKNAARIRRQAAKPSPALENAGAPVLDYLLGSDDR